MSEYIDNHSRRQDALKRMITQLHAGRTVDEVKSQFAELLAEVDAAEIAVLEQALIAEGMPAMEIKRLCDVHVAAFQDALNARAAAVNAQADPPHPLSQRIIAQLKKANSAAGRTLDGLETAVAAGRWAEAREWAQRLRAHELHYQRKENVLFPYLEKHGFGGPSTVMWAIHDDIRAALKQLPAVLNGQPDPAQAASVLGPLAEAIRQMFYKEENIIFPTALQTLTPDEWAAIAAVDQQPGVPDAAGATPPSPGAGDLSIASTSNLARLIPLDVGGLTAQQIGLLLTHLPIDVTFVDEEDEVRFYSAGRERVFDRQPAIIGRKVQQCHPPTSMHRVQQILDDFRAGQRSTAEFWIQMGASDGQGGKFIHIRYFAMRDAQGTYRGTLEVTQDVTGIRQMEGERRLLDEDE
jgi:uncharacterized protein